MNGQFLYRTSHTICTPHMKPYYCSVFKKWDIIRFLRGIKTPFLISTRNEWSVLIEDIPYCMHTHMKPFTAAFSINGTLFDFWGYKDTISNKYTKWMVSSYRGHPILYAHLIWNHITAAFSRNETLFDLEDYKDPISNKYTKWMVSSYIGHPILYALLIWNHFTAAFLRYGTLHFREL